MVDQPRAARQEQPTISTGKRNYARGTGKRAELHDHEGKGKKRWLPAAIIPDPTEEKNASAVPTGIAWLYAGKYVGSIRGTADPAKRLAIIYVIGISQEGIVVLS